MIDQRDPYTTVLSLEEQAKYSQWKMKLPKNLQYEGDYDLAGLWKSDPNVKPSTNLHFPDKFKKPNHPTFSDESIYFGPDTKKFAGRWEETSDAWVYVPYDEKTKRKVVEMKNEKTH